MDRAKDAQSGHSVSEDLAHELPPNMAGLGRHAKPTATKCNMTPRTRKAGPGVRPKNLMDSTVLFPSIPVY